MFFTDQTQIKFHISALMDTYMFRECIAFVKHGLECNGYQVTYADNQLRADSINIVFASHCNAGNWTELSKQAKHIIVYNWEPASPLIGRFNQAYIRLMQHVHVWDYSTKNVHELHHIAGIEDIHYVPMGYAPSMSMIEDVPEKDIDVLFYGTISHRRRVVINEMRALGLHVVTSEDVGQIQDAARDALIARSKVLLNVHVYDFVQIFEIARVSYWLANKTAVVTEVSPDTEIADDLKQAMVCGSIGELAQLCHDLVHDEPRRQALSQRSFEIFKKRSAADLMKTAVDRYLRQSEKQPPQIGNVSNATLPMPKVIHLGSGSIQFVSGFQWAYHRCNIDRRADFSPDVVLDLSQPLPFGESIQSWRFGEVKLERGFFEHIFAVDFFQRVPNLRQALTNCLDLLQDGGTLNFSVPLDMSLEARQHVDDKRFFNEQTVEKLLENWWQYGWDTHRFEMYSTALGLKGENAFAFEFLGQNNNDWEAALRTARVVNQQDVVLRKRALTADEIKHLPYNRFLA